METNKKITIGLISLACVTSAALIGTAAGSLAWYAYSRTVTASFKGTSVANSALLNVGLIDDDLSHPRISSATIARYGLTKEAHDGHVIVFTHSTNGFSYDVINEYLTNAGGAVDVLSPVTTQSRALSSTANLSLYRSPEYGETNINTAADVKSYVVLPFAFRVGDSANEGAVNTDVWLTGSSVHVDHENIHQAVRIFIENSERKFLMKPASSETTKGSTKVGGLLDLDGDGTYDYNANNGHDEYYYGECTGTPTNATTEYGGSQSEAPMVNVNGVADTSAPSTFYAKHNIASKIINNLDQITPKVAEFETFGTVCPPRDSNGQYYASETRGISIAKTSGPTGVGYANFTIFVEGWDHSVIDKAAGYEFTLDLKFEINSVTQ